MTYKTAPEDSSLWKCHWLVCAHGCGLAGNGCCTAGGTWNKTDCQKYEIGTCDHGVKLDKVCKRCQRRGMKGSSIRPIGIYQAGPLFGIADLVGNLSLERDLKKLGYKVFLPQRDAAVLLPNGKLDIMGTCTKCAQHAQTCDVLVANLDGPDADSGTSFEVAAALNSPNKPRPLVIVIRTDFRTSQENEVGINGMFKLADRLIYNPAYCINSFKSVDFFYETLALSIDKTIKELLVLRNK